MTKSPWEIWQHETNKRYQETKVPQERPQEAMRSPTWGALKVQACVDWRGEWMVQGVFCSRLTTGPPLMGICCRRAGAPRGRPAGTNSYIILNTFTTHAMTTVTCTRQMHCGTEIWFFHRITLHIRTNQTISFLLNYFILLMQWLLNFSEKHSIHSFSYRHDHSYFEWVKFVLNGNFYLNQITHLFYQMCEVLWEVQKTGYYTT